MKWSFIALVLFVTGITCCCCLQVRSFYYTLRTSNNYVCTIDSSIAPDLAHQITTHLKTNLQHKLPHEIDDALTTTFPIIDTLTIARTQPNALHVFIKSSEPIANLNNTHIITHSGYIAPQNYFEKHVSDYIPTLVIAPELLINTPEVLKKFISTLPENITAQYTVIIEHPHKILLQDNEEQQFFILTNYQRLPQNSLEQACQQLKQQKIHDGSWLKKKKKLIADIRFDNQIIMSFS